MISKVAIQRVREAANDNIVELASQYAQLRKVGKHYVAGCIFHKERTPSLSFTPGQGFFCFGCGASGDAIRFVMTAEQIDFPSAVGKLAARFGISLENVGQSRGDAELRLWADAAAWRAYDQIAHLRRYYTAALHRSDRLCASIGERLRREHSLNRWDSPLWDSLVRLATAQTFFLSAFLFISNAAPHNLARFALASPAERRKFFLEGCDHAATSAAA